MQHRPVEKNNNKRKTMGNKSKTDSKLPTEKAGKPNMSKKKKKLLLHLLWAKTQQVPKCKANSHRSRIQLPSWKMSAECRAERILSNSHAHSPAHSRARPLAPRLASIHLMYTHTGGPPSREGAWGGRRARTYTYVHVGTPVPARPPRGGHSAAA